MSNILLKLEDIEELKNVALLLERHNYPITSKYVSDLTERLRKLLINTGFRGE